jgi:hypothetical protein
MLPQTLNLIPFIIYPISSISQIFPISHVSLHAAYAFLLLSTIMCACRSRFLHLSAIADTSSMIVQSHSSRSFSPTLRDRSVLIFQIFHVSLHAAYAFLLLSTIMCACRFRGSFTSSTVVLDSTRSFSHLSSLLKQRSI